MSSCAARCYSGSLPLRYAVAFLAAAGIAAGGVACRSAAPATAGAPIIQPGAPGEASRAVSAQTATDLSQVQFIGADIKFMQGMIGHHGQAIEMTELLMTHTESASMKQLALRIQVSQVDEIKMMQHWLQSRGQPIPAPGAMHMHGATLMPGMLTEEEMAALAASRGAAFDRLFLAGMIRHHNGALTMVSELFASPGAAQESEVFAFASDVDADQRMEIDRMSAMLKELGR
jgi:uncharacterized protein (DUF305 family)